jgi:hypothetical protein
MVSDKYTKNKVYEKGYEILFMKEIHLKSVPSAGIVVS